MPKDKPKVAIVADLITKAASAAYSLGNQFEGNDYIAVSEGQSMVGQGFDLIVLCPSALNMSMSNASNGSLIEWFLCNLLTRRSPSARVIQLHEHILEEVEKLQQIQMKG